MMKICFINPPIYPYRRIVRNFDCATESKGSYLYQPYDFLLLSSHINDEEFIFIDCIRDKISDSDALTCISSFEPTHIVISIAQTSIHYDLAFIDKIRKINEDVIIISFGDIFFNKGKITKVEEAIDLGITDPVYFNFDELKGLDRNQVRTKSFKFKWKSEFYKRPDLKAPDKVNINIPKHEKFISDKYQWPFSRKKLYTTVFTSWGCPYSCSYCIMSNFPNLIRDPNDIFNELKYIVEALSVQEIYIGDRSFGLPLVNTKVLLNKIIEEKLNISWSSYFHPNQYTPELLKLMKESGCHTLIIGIETASFNDLKKFGRHMKEDRFHMLLSHAKDIGIQICGDFIFGLPGQTKKEILDTIQYSCDIDIDYASFNIAAPLPGSIIKDIAVKEGKIDELAFGFDSLGSHGVLSNDELSGEELIRLRNMAVRKFYFNPKYLISRFRKIKSIDHFKIQVSQGLAMIKSLLGAS